MIALTVATIALKIGLAATVFFVAALVFDALAYAGSRQKTPEWLAVIGGLTIIASLIAYTVAAIAFIFS